MRFDGSNNDYRLSTNRVPKITKKQLLEIEKRQRMQQLLSNRKKIEEYQKEVFGIIENNGLYSEDEKIQLETALKVLPYIAPQKKAAEITHINKTIEDIIKENTEEAEIIEEQSDPKQPEDEGNED